MIVKRLFDLIEKGKEGNNIGIPTDMPKFDKATYGIQRGTMSVIAGDTGAGKSTLALWRNVYCPIKHALANDLKNIHILYYSFEMASELLLAKLLSLYIYDTYGYVAPHEKILSFTEIISPDLYNYVLKSREWLDMIEDDLLTIEDRRKSSGGIWKSCTEWCNKFGRTDIILNEKGQEFEVYTANDKDQYLIVVVDHIKLLKITKNSVREEIEACSNYLIALRNRYNISPCVVQQLNRNSKAMDRKMNGFEMLGLDDLSDSSAPSQAAEQVIGIFFPHREKIAVCEGYPIKTVFKDRIRILQILKNRYGRSDTAQAVSFYGEIGYWKELPLPTDLKQNDYNQYLVLDENKIDEENEEDIEENNIFIFN